MLRKLEGLSDRQVLGLILAVAVGTSVVSWVLHLVAGMGTSADWWAGWLQNLGSEMLGAFATFLLIHLLVGGREEKGRLIRQMRSRDNALALQAVAELGAKGWLGDGALRGANLVSANLHRLKLWDTILVEADLHGVNLAGSKLDRVNFTRANLWAAELRGARLTSVNLESADLFHADLREVTFAKVEFNEDTRLPDGSRWHPEADLGRFTDEDHPDFFDVESARAARDATEEAPPAPAVNA